ncbi:hypothetical protein NE865_08978 [Phthorimaea operculella]|nr:hypothetical protein NE865_08978 [Phthorimaea operculella]
MVSGTASMVPSVIVVVLVIYAADMVSSSRCPPPSQIYEHENLESCHSDHQCPQDKVCCVTPARSKACIQPAFGSQGGHDRHEHGRNPNNGIYCGNKKCGPFEKCAEERGRATCKRA